MDTKTVDLETLIRTYFAALNSNDLAQIVKLFTDDAVIMLNDTKTVVGRDTVRATYEHGFSTLTFARDLHIDEVSADGDLAFVRSHSTGTVTPTATGKAMEELARELFVLQRVSGTWRIRCYMMNHPKG